MKIRISAALAATLVLASAATAQIAGPRTRTGCIDVTGSQARLTVTGRLSFRRFPGPPNYQSIARGDAAEPTFILTLPRPVCLSDGGEFADPAERVTTVQIGANCPLLRASLRAAIGRRVTVTGEGFAAHTGHHHAPLVMMADRVGRR